MAYLPVSRFPGCKYTTIIAQFGTNGKSDGSFGSFGLFGLSGSSGLFGQFR
jgi:hypothetical protein